MPAEGERPEKSAAGNKAALDPKSFQSLVQRVSNLEAKMEEMLDVIESYANRVRDVTKGQAPRTEASRTPPKEEHPERLDRNFSYLKTYISSCLAQNYPKEMIMEALRNAGYSEADIETAFMSLNL